MGRRPARDASWAEGGVVLEKAVRTTDRTDQQGPRRKPPFQPCSSVKSVKSVVKTGAAFGGESRPSALPAALREAKGVGWGGNGSLGGAVASGDGDGMSGAVLDRMNGMDRMGREGFLTTTGATGAKGRRAFGRFCRGCRGCEDPGSHRRCAVGRGEAARGSCSSCASCLSLFLDRMNGMDRMGRGTVGKPWGGGRSCPSGHPVFPLF